MSGELRVEACNNTHVAMHQQAMRSIDVALVARNWLLGRHIVTYEQNGSDRAQYGDKVIDRLARQLEIKGVSATNIRKFRQLYLEYPIQQSLSVEHCNGAKPWQL